MNLFLKGKKKRLSLTFFHTIENRVRTRMILNIFQDWSGGFCISSLGLISWDNYTGIYTCAQIHLDEFVLLFFKIQEHIIPVIVVGSCRDGWSL